MSGKAVLFAVHGLIWVDPETYQIVRTVMENSEPKQEVGLMGIKLEISYVPVRFNAGSTPFWLPGNVVVTMRD